MIATVSVIPHPEILFENGGLTCKHYLSIKFSYGELGLHHDSLQFKILYLSRGVVMHRQKNRTHDVDMEHNDCVIPLMALFWL